jgi:hypothetical protein
MKTAIAVFAAVILSSLAASASTNPPGCDLGTSKATTCLARYWAPVSVTAFLPCLNQGRGENVTFTDTESTIFYYTVTNGKRNGFFMHVGGGPMFGKGQTTGIQYGAHGSTQNSLADWIPFNPDGSANGDGEFTYTDNYAVYSIGTSPVQNHVWHRTRRFIFTNNSNNLQLQPDEVVCQ